ncbi:MAG: metal ABC transporter permease [Trueperaceae bacterium]
MDELFSFLTDFTIRNVVFGSALLGITSGVLGSFAVLRQQSLLGDALSHAALPGIALGFLIAGERNLIAILLGALLSGALAAAYALLLTRRTRLKNDAALGSVLSVFFAVGIVLLTFIQNQNNAGQAGLESFLFGQAATIVPSDILTMLVISGLCLGLTILFWRHFKVLSFDTGFARSLGFPTLTLEFTLTLMIALAIVMGLQLVGVVLMAALLIAPAVAARQWTKKLEHMVLLAALFGAISGVAGSLLSATGRGLSTGPLIVIFASLFVVISLLFAPGRGFIWEALQFQRNKRSLHAQQVLVDLYKLANEHNDPHYQTELGMLSSYYGVNVRQVLHELGTRGHVTTGQHMQGEGQHWTLTAQGYEEAKRILEQLGKRD